MIISLPTLISIVQVITCLHFLSTVILHSNIPLKSTYYFSCYFLQFNFLLLFIMVIYKFMDFPLCTFIQLHYKSTNLKQLFLSGLQQVVCNLHSLHFIYYQLMFQVTIITKSVVNDDVKKQTLRNTFKNNYKICNNKQ